MGTFNGVLFIFRIYSDIWDDIYYNAAYLNR